MILEKQYEMVRFSRRLLFDFLETIPDADFNKPVELFNGKTINGMLQHNASCYVDWLGYYSMGLPYWSAGENEFPDISSIRKLYEDRIDPLMKSFLEKYADDPSLPINDVPKEWGPGGASAIEVFTQVTTHEFHHKGQIVFLCRFLGYTPPDTDVRRYFPNEP